MAIEQKPEGVREGWTKNRRYDKGVTEDVCPHGIGHEDGIHGCDGCCTGLYNHDEKKREVQRRPLVDDEAHDNEGDGR